MSDCVCNATRMMCPECYTKLITRDWCVDCNTFNDVIKCDVCDKRLCKNCLLKCREKGCNTMICSDCYRPDPRIKPGKCMKHRTYDRYAREMKLLRIKSCELCNSQFLVFECSICDKFICDSCTSECYTNEDGGICQVPICYECIDDFPLCALCDH
jgi:hypothetical protein